MSHSFVFSQTIYEVSLLEIPNSDLIKTFRKLLSKCCSFTSRCCKRGKMIKSTLLLVILLIVLAEGSFKNRFSHIRYAITPGGGRSGRSLPQNCEGRLEFILTPSNKGAELKTVGEKKKNLRTSSRESYKAKSYGNCCWILYSR